ncbi:MAG: SHOCT domain-containing protein [Sulfurimonas sp.]|jgi:hypothetical protein
MANKLFNLVLMCTIVFVVGIFADPKIADIRIGDVMMFVAVLYFIVALWLLVTKKQSVMEYVKLGLNIRQNNKAEDELLRSKKLFDNGIITQDEFDDRVKILKESMITV